MFGENIEFKKTGKPHLISRAITITSLTHQPYSTP
jgi:hypothetical protein